MPGAFGDPFRAIEAFPGVTPVLSGVPYFYVRGAPPSGTLYTYDHITLPALFHLGLGPSVVHPRMVGPLRLYSGVPPARFGRFIGGVIEAEGPEPFVDDLIHGEAEARLLDVNGFLRVPLGDSELLMAGRYGYPGLLLSIFSPEIDLAYWDYQSRFSHSLGNDDWLELVALGAYDSLTTYDPADADEENSLSIHFHRFEARFIRKRASFDLGVAMRLGWEASSLDDEVSIESFTWGPRLWLTVPGEVMTLRLGAELLGAAGSMDFGDDGPAGGGGMGGMPNPQDPSRNEAFASVAARNMAALYGELTWKPWSALSLDLGLRTDTWVTGSSIEAALDPRIRATIHASEALDFHLSVGVARQPAVFIIQLPGLTDVAIDRGLQTALQGEAGVRVEPIEDLDIEAQVFVHRYWGLLFPDLFIEDDVCAEVGVGCRDVEPDPRVDGVSYGGEIFIRRPPSERISGFASYTLAWAELDGVAGIDYTPSYDVRHVLNVAGRVEIVDGFTVGLRSHFRTGKILGVWYLSLEELALKRYEQRLPSFFRLDAEIAYAWRTSWGQLRVALEWLNLTWSEEPTALACPDGLATAPPTCEVEYLPAIVAPNLGIRGTF
jgi:hypothetical protein